MSRSQPLDNVPADIAPAVFKLLREIRRTPDGFLRLPLVPPADVCKALDWLDDAQWIDGGAFGGEDGPDHLTIWPKDDATREAR